MHQWLLLFRKDVRQDLAAAEVVIIKIDAAKNRFLKINRPLNQLDYQMIIGGMIKFRTEFDGQVWWTLCLSKRQ
jgi:wyosine [tRNA(Phe)-imidazoG37] synthetase (radical SAM superfamily)